MRRIVLAVLVAVLGLPSAPARAQGLHEFAAAGGGVMVGLAFEPATLNPYLPGGNFEVSEILDDALFAGVWDVDVNGELVPDVVTELPTAANGRLTDNGNGTLTIDYDIRPEATWADGVAISGDDFQFTLDTLLNPSYPTNKTGYEDIVSTTVGAKSFSFTIAMTGADHQLLFPVIIPEHVVAGTDFINEWNDEIWVSGGPFSFVSWNQGFSIELARNPNYWMTDPATGQQLPYLDTLTFEFLFQEGELADAYVAGTLDIIEIDWDDPALGAVDAVAGSTLFSAGSGTWEHLAFQFGPGRFSENPDSFAEHLDFRKAVAHAVDRDGLVADVWNGRAQPIDSHLDAYAPSLGAGSWAQYDHDPTQAITLLANLCASLGRDCAANPPQVVLTTTDANPFRVELAAALEPMLTAVGIDFSIVFEDSATFFGPTLENGDFDLGEWAWTAEPRPESLIQGHESFDKDSTHPAGLNYYRWGSPDSSAQNADTQQVGSLYDQMLTEPDPPSLLSLAGQIEQIVADNVVIIPLAERPVVAAVRTDRVSGFEMGRGSSIAAPSGLAATVAHWQQAVSMAGAIVESVLVGDFDGDGVDDVAEFDRSEGRWWVQSSSGSHFTPELWADFSTASGWEARLVGDFTGDGLDDIAQFHPSNGTWWVSVSNGSGFETALWADFSTASGWQARLAGDFTGDGLDDIAQFHPSNGTWWVSVSNGSGFETALWADFSTASGWEARLVGDFDGNGFDDVAQFHPSNGTWWVTTSTGAAFVTKLWADFSTASGWQARLAGDFTGDGLDDIAQFHPSNGTWWVTTSTGAAFVTKLWADFGTADGWLWRSVGDFDGDGFDDIAQFHPSNNTWWVSESSGTAFITTLWGDHS